jgi:hypothetical protein
MAIVSADSASCRRCVRSAAWVRSSARGGSGGRSHLLTSRTRPAHPATASIRRVQPTGHDWGIAWTPEAKRDMTGVPLSDLRIGCRRSWSRPHSPSSPYSVPRYSCAAALDRRAWHDPRVRPRTCGVRANARPIGWLMRAVGAERLCRTPTPCLPRFIGASRRRRSRRPPATHLDVFVSGAPWRLMPSHQLQGHYSSPTRPGGRVALSAASSD